MMRNRIRPKSCVLSFKILGATLFFVLLTSSASAATYYIAPSPVGDDSHPGTSVMQPWATPHKARDVVVAGDTVYFRQGTYPITKFVYLNKTAGTQELPIVWASYPGETATLAFAATTDPGEQAAWTFFVARAYHHFERLRFTQTPESREALMAIPRIADAFSVWAAGVEIRDCEILEMTGQGIYGSSSADNMVVERNHIHHIDPGVYSGIAAPHGVYTSGQNQTIRDNVIHDIFYFCIKLAQDATGKVYRNFCHHAGEGITCQNGPGLGLDVDIFNNVVTHMEFHASNAQGVGINIYNGGGARVFNNTIANCNQGALVKNTPNTPVFRNNIFVDNKVHFVTERQQFDTDYNLFEPSSGPLFQSKAKSFLGDLSVWQVNYGDAHSVAGDPKLVGSGIVVGDYKIQSGSAAIDAGVAAEAPGEDFFKVSRPIGLGYDIGAHEWAPDGPPEAPKNLQVR